MPSFFELEKNNSTVSTEFIAGVSSFLATSYIIVVNPSVLSQAGMPFAAVLTATVLVSFFSSLMMGLYARNPVLVAPGMGLNAFFTFSAVIGMKVPWTVALGAVFWSGIIFLLLSVFNIRTHIVRAIPRPLRYAIAAGIGLFITLIGLVNARFIIASPATIVGIGPMTPALLSFLAGLLLTALLVIRRVKGAILLGIVFTTLLAWPLGRWWGTEVLVNGHGVFAAPDFSLLFRLDLVNSLKWSVAPVIFAFVFTDMFDSLSTFVGLAEASGLLDENGEPKNLKRSLITDAVATTAAGLLGSSPGTAYIESAVGIEAGGRTGLTAVTGALLFLPFLFLAPLLSMIPPLATAPALVLVGVFMIRPVIKIDWLQLDEAIPAFLAMVIIPFTYSITQGITWGLLSWTALQLLSARRHRISPALWIIDLFAVLSLVPRHLLLVLVLLPASFQQLSAQAKPAREISPAQPVSSAPSASADQSSATAPAKPPAQTQAVTGILGAFPAETELLLSHVEQKKDTIIRHVRFTAGILNGRAVVVAQSGIGKVNAAFTTTLLLDHFQPSEIIFTGIAGAVDPALSPGDLVIGTTVAYHDYGSLLPDSMQRRATRNPSTMLENPFGFPCDARLVRLADSASQKIILERTSGPASSPNDNSASSSKDNSASSPGNDGTQRATGAPKITHGIIVTGDVFVSSQSATQQLFLKMHASATEMEGAAVAQVCWQQQVPFLVIRSMSDRAGNNASADVQSFYRIAARNSANLVMAIVGMLPPERP